MGFALVPVPKLVALNDHEARNGCLQASYVTVIEVRPILSARKM